MKKCLVLMLIFALMQSSACFALDWIVLHTRADTLTEAKAQAGVVARPKSVEDLYLLGLVYLHVHKDDLAKGCFERMLSLDPKAFEADWGIAEVMRRRHKLAEARDILIPMIKEHPDYSPAYITLAYIKYLELDFNAAVRLATKVFEKGKSGSDLSNYVRSYLMYAGAKGAIADKGGVLSKIINGTAVLPNLKKAESLQPESAEVKYGLGSFYLLAPSFVGGDLKSAETYLTEAVKLDPLFPNAYVRLGEVYKMKGDKDRYRQYLNKALELDPENEIAISVREGNCKYVCAEPEVKPEGN